MSLVGVILLVVLLIFVVGAMPHWGYHGPTYATNYGWGPSGGLSLILVIILVLVLVGRI